LSAGDTKPWKEDSTEDKDVGYYLKLADAIDLAYVFTLKKKYSFLSQNT